jgi:hypothetical protein
LVKLRNVSSVWTGGEGEDMGGGVWKGEDIPEGAKDVYIRDGQILCITFMDSSRCRFPDSVNLDSESAQIEEEIDLNGGTILPGFTSFGSPLGLEEISLEPSTNDGSVPDALTGSIPSILGGDKAVVRAVDGLTFNGRNLLYVFIPSHLPN